MLTDESIVFQLSETLSTICKRCFFSPQLETCCPCFVYFLFLSACDSLISVLRFFYVSPCLRCTFWIHLIPKWSLVFIQISPWCLVLQLKMQMNILSWTRHQRPICMRINQRPFWNKVYSNVVFEYSKNYASTMKKSHLKTCFDKVSRLVPKGNTESSYNSACL